MATHNCVYETSTGDLLRCGYCDFENDGSFNAGTETMVECPMNVCQCREGVGHDGQTQWHRWTGAAFELVSE